MIKMIKMVSKMIPALLAVLFLLCSCRLTEPVPHVEPTPPAPLWKQESDVEQVDSHKIVVGCALQNFNPDERNLVRLLSEKIADDNLPIEIEFLDGKRSVEIQLSQVEYFIARKVDIILLNPLSYDGSAPVVSAANNSKIPLVTILSTVDEQTAGGIACYIGNDSFAVGSEQCRMMAEQLGKGRIAVLKGIPENSGQILKSDGYLEVLEQYPEIEVVGEQFANQSESEAYSIVENWLYNGIKLDAVLAQNDSMAAGAKRAIAESIEREKGLRSINIYGVDVDAVNLSENPMSNAVVTNDDVDEKRVEELESIKVYGAGGYMGENPLDGTVNCNFESLADKIIKSILKLHRKEGVERVQIIPISAVSKK